MTMGYCRTCNRDVHITHDASECTGEPDVSVPELQRERVEQNEHDEPAEDEPDVY